MSYIQNVLPIKYPIITSYPWHACALSILSSDNKCFPWIYSSYIQLRTSEVISDTNSKPCMKLEFLFFDHEYSDIIPWFRSLSQKLFRETMNLITKRNGTSFVDFIIENIDNEYYLILHLDDFYIPDTDGYERHNIHHQYVIYGYNCLEKTFNIGGFYKYHKFRFAKIAFSQLEKAYDNSKDFPIKLLKIQKDFKWDFSIKVVNNFLKDYLNSNNSLADRGIYSPICYNEKYGIDIYERLKTFIKIIIDTNDYKADIRPFHMLWEHKKNMIELCKYLSQFVKIDSINDIIDDYIKIERTALIIRNKILKFNITSNINILCTVEALFDELSTAESEVIDQMLKLMPNVIL